MGVCCPGIHVPWPEDFQICHHVQVMSTCCSVHVSKIQLDAMCTAHCRSVGEYVAILVLLIKRDVPKFVTVFIVIIFSLGGALYFALTGNYSDENIDTENNNDTR